MNIVELQGTTGSAPANDRKKGFADVIPGDPKFKIIASQTGEFTRAKGKEVMEAFLKAQRRSTCCSRTTTTWVWARSRRSRRAGMKPGKDIKIITIDAVKDGMTALAEGKINYIVECNPLLGPQLMDLVKKVKAGETIPQRVVTEETAFTPEQAKAALPNRKY